ncbi:MAG: S41 family peptidase [Cyanobacteria bacterium CRU_2_1]|nr:S41 family peptidase [Cyanobacteria bacterium CRU_2_1]
MRRNKLARRTNLAIVSAISILVVLLCWSISPILPGMARSQTEVFEEVWQTINENFYDPNFNGVDWNAMRNKYEPLVSQARSREEVAVVINQMLSELNTSHTRFYTPDDPAYYQILGIFSPRSRELQEQVQSFLPDGKIEYTGIGIFTKTIEDQLFISAILDGSPAAIAGLQVGDQILSVDGQSFHPIHSFENKADQDVTLLIQRSPEPNSQQEIVVTPRVFDATTMFIEAQDASIQVLEQNSKKIGYIHIWSYANEQAQQLLEEELLYNQLSETDGFVLDLRDGWGGTPITVLNLYTGRGPSVTSVFRDGTRYISDSHWKKPVVMLVNEGSRSAKEILAYGFQQYEIGAVVGTQTAGAVVAGRPFLMQDGSLLYVAIADVYVDGDKRLEGIGVTPDVVVPLPLEYAQGVDPQKERAIATTLEIITQSE